MRPTTWLASVRAATRWASRRRSGLTRPAKAGTAGVRPDIAAVAAIDAQLDVVAMTSRPKLEYEHQFVLRAIETPHAGVRLGPDAEVEHLQRRRPGGCEKLIHVPPIHADESGAAGLA